MKKFYLLCVAIAPFLGWGQKKNMAAANPADEKAVVICPATLESDEYVDGIVSLYDYKTKKSMVLDSSVIMSHSDAFLTKENKIFVFHLSYINVYNTAGKPVDDFEFDSTEQVMGADYNSDANKFVFLLANIQSKKVHIYTLDVNSREMKNVFPDFESDFINEVESPFRTINYYDDQHVYIDKQCNSFYQINLQAKSRELVKISNAACGAVVNAFNTKCLYSFFYLNNDKSKYQLIRHDLLSGKEETILKASKDAGAGIHIFTDEHSANVLVQVDKSLSVYGADDVKKIVIPNLGMVIAFDKGGVFYLDRAGRLKYYK